MRDARLVAATAVAPALWGSTYIIATELLPAHRPLLAAAVRALPAGLLLIVAVVPFAGRRALPSGVWWHRSLVLGMLNVGVFFVLLFIAAYRLPGGIAAIPGALGPFAAAALALPLLGERMNGRVLLAATVGVVGVALMVGRSSVHLDALGLVAAFAGTVSMSAGTVYGRHWGAPEGYRAPAIALLALTGWQLAAGGLFLVPLALAVEGMPPHLTGRNVAGFVFMSLVTTAFAFFLWVRGVTRLASVRVSLLARLSPVVATILGWAILGQSLTALQLVGAAIVVVAVFLGVAPAAAGTAA